MRKSLVLLGVAACAVLLATSASADNRGVSFTGVGFIDPPGNFPYSAVLSMNPSGTVFMANPASRGNYCVQWTREGGWGTQIGSTDSVCRISDAGTIMAGGIYPGSNPAYAWPGTWTGTLNEWDPIPPDPQYAACGSSRMSFYDMGGEGDYAVGLTWYAGCKAQGFLWNKATDSSIGLGTPNGSSTRANAVTTDGAKVIGWTTPKFGTRRGAFWQNGSWTNFNDPQGIEPKMCISSGGTCSENSASTTRGCPEYVDDGFCTNKGTCTANVCVGGPDAGKTCTSSSQCRGVCVGPSAGTLCTSNGSCPDTPVCVPNPAWTDDKFKGESYDVTDDGQYAIGRNFDFGLGWDIGWRSNPDGTFTQLLPPETWPYLVDPYRISQDGKTIVGRAGVTMTGTAPIFWREGVGTVDLQYFLIQQGLDELYFWLLTDAYDVSADGSVIVGRGANPDGRFEGFVVDMKKVWVCHAPPGHPEMARTLGIDHLSMADHVAHGDFLGTCEFLNSGGLVRANNEISARRAAHVQDATDSPFGDGSGLSPWGTDFCTEDVTVAPRPKKAVGERQKGRKHQD